MLALWPLGWGYAHVRTSCTTPGLEHADFFLQFLNVQDGLLKYLQLELLFLSLLVLGGLLRVLRRELVVIVVIVCALVDASEGELPPGIGRHEVPQHREGFVDLGAPGLLDARMVLPAHRFAGST